jgi:hypothetical protein
VTGRAFEDRGGRDPTVAPFPPREDLGPARPQPRRTATRGDELPQPATTPLGDARRRPRARLGVSPEAVRQADHARREPGASETTHHLADLLSDALIDRDRARLHAELFLRGLDPDDPDL